MTVYQNATPLRDTVIRSEMFQVPSRYTLVKQVGKGAYGVVVTALDSTTKTKIAIKKNKKVFDHGPQCLHMSLRVLRELKILAHLDHPNIISIKDVIIPSSYEQFTDIYFVTECMETDLRNILRSRQPLSDGHVQFIMYQLISALNYTHSASVLHRDLKPENILINSDSSIRLCDYGLARGIDFENDPTMSTTYVQTRWYRAPELLLNYKIVSKQADIWSAGCIMAELLTGQILFKGNSPVDQIEKIVEVLGTPRHNEEIKGSPQGIEFISKLKKTTGISFESLLMGANPLAIDLINKMLTFNPDNRISAESALRHPYFVEYFDESTASTCSTKFDFDYESSLVDVESIKLEAYHTILELNGYSTREQQEGTDTTSFDELKGDKGSKSRRSSLFKKLFEHLNSKRIPQVISE
ncbi:hypothetical protein AKO1_010162 [Acrasis kona]|uniref:Protein kinase domain-containing protein n=1 Tax=Acrasis kona TaxID=1008807 RepID=A0AAW2ZQL3_9EUKA